MNKKKHDSLYSIWTLMILLCVLLVLFSLLFASFTRDYSLKEAKTDAAAAQTAAAQPAAAQTSAPVKALSTAALLAETPDAGDTYIARMTFLSDSTTAGLKTYGLLADKESTTKVLTTSDGSIPLSGIASVKLVSGSDSVSISDAVAAAKPDILVVTVGENGCAFMGKDYFTSSYTSLLQTLKTASPDTVIICGSILPVSQTYAAANSMKADTIQTANNWIQQAAADNGCKYADTFSVLSGADGYLKSDYDSGDGITPNSAGLLAMLGYLRTHAVQ
jgi:lysophospholipase L1-like esterase